MLRIEKIANDGKTVSIKYSQVDGDNGKIENYNVKSNRTPEPEFFEAWEDLKKDLPDLMRIKDKEGVLELRKITLKRGSVLCEQNEYKVQFDGSVYAEGGTDYQFKTGIREGFWEERDENEDAEYIGTGKELSKEITGKVNAVIECTLAYIKGASAQQNLFPENDTMDGAEDESDKPPVVEEY